ncbi:hypothetical protein FRC11_000939, partial [Ceratobasidium sp. 423]
CRLSPSVPAHIEPCLPTRPDMYLSSLVIHPEFQGRGLGRQMIKQLQSLGRSMALDVWAGNDRLRIPAGGGIKSWAGGSSLLWKSRMEM